MNEAALPIRPEDLLRHQEFVGALARRLVRDPHAAQDLAQETWLTALRRPPRSAESLRGWLARVVRSHARGERRAGTRREDRERLVARADVDGSAEEARERLALQQSVVAAVLELREPYRSVVLLRWFEDLPAGEIAHRRGVPAGTVRAQLTRALAILRERLDAEHGGDRAAWSVALLVLAGRRSVEAAKLATLAAGAALLAGLAAIPLVRALAPETASAPASMPTAGDSSSAEPSAEAAEPAVAALSSGREAVESPAALALDAPQLGSFADTKTEELMQTALEVQALLRKRLLGVGDALHDEYAPVLAEPDTGLARILRLERFDLESNEPLGIRGGGAYYSFTSRSHSYDDQPQLELQRGRYGVQFHGGQRGFIADLGDAEVEGGLPSASRLGGRSTAARQAWRALALEGFEDEEATAERLTRAASELGLGSSARAETGHLYLVRSISSGEHDVLAAFIPVQSDAYGDTILWRILRTWPVKDRGRSRERAGDGPAPTDVAPWLGSLSVEDLLETQRRLREEGERRLLGVPEELRASLPAGTADGTAGVARILSRGIAGPLIAKRGGGAYLSFVTGEASYDREPSLHLDAGRFQSGFYGGAIGLVLELGDLPLDRVTASMHPPAPVREAWRFLWDVELADAPEVLAPDDLRKASELGLRRGAPALANTTYLLRSISPGEHDVLAAFRTVDTDAYGCTIAWRLLRSVPLPAR